MNLTSAEQAEKESGWRPAHGVTAEKSPVKLLIIAGEVSGDIHGAALVRALCGLAPGLEVAGTGGSEMRQAGVKTLYDISELAVMGFVEVLKHIKRLRVIFADMVGYAEAWRPDAAILIDYPGFNLRLAKELERRGIPVIYYICPQVWAWKRSRIKGMALTIEHLITIFPFERECFEECGLRVDYVGHPLVDELADAREQRVGTAQTDCPRLALLPGSRETEIRRLLPVMLAAAGRLGGGRRIKCIIAAANPEMGRLIKHIIAQTVEVPSDLTVQSGRTRRILSEADAAIVASGTATVETMLLGCPMVVVYKVAPLTYAIGKRVIKLPHIGMVNILAGREICPELIQAAATPEAIAQAVEPLLADTPQRRRMCRELAETAALLGHGGSAQKAAEMIMADLQKFRAGLRNGSIR